MSQRTAASIALGLALGLSAVTGLAQAETVILAPEIAGRFVKGNGVNGAFLKVRDDWQQSSVLWDESSQSFGSGAAVSSFAWGSGLWGLADWQTANHNPTPGMIEGSWSGHVRSIAFGDAMYNNLYGSTWGAVPLAPLFGRHDETTSQDNWTSRFAGYIRITKPGLYNFGVLHDDGFFFRLGGAQGQTLALSNDYLNPRDNLGFASNLQLGTGLYSFEMGAYDRLEAGVVGLTWWRDGGPWKYVPSANLVASVEVTSVPEPGPWALMLAGLLTLGALASRRRSPTR